MYHSYVTLVSLSLTLKQIAGIVSNTEGNMSIYICKKVISST